MIDTTQPSLNDFIEQKLNKPQQEAVKQEKGSLLVIAGAGSGKTRVIIARIAHLIINKGVNPASIVALTFTNKAAKEMLERIIPFLGAEHGKPFIGTFHGYCLRILKKYQAHKELPPFSILDTDDQTSLLNKIIHRYALNKKTSAQQLLYAISALKNKAIMPDADLEGVSSLPWIKQVYTAYESAKKESNCFDFDDLLLETLKIFKSDNTFKTLFQHNINHILIDEYQDTNLVQHELLKQMALDSDNQCALDSICAVGDEDQSIYSWRGATISNIINYKDDFAPTTMHKLEQNYRSVQPILTFANSVITNNTLRNPKNLWSERSGHDTIRHALCFSDYQEAEVIAHAILVAREVQSLNSIAILYRTHFQSRSLEEALMRHAIPYKIVGGVQFYERKEIKDLLAYLRLIVNPHDRPAFMRIINCPPRLLGEKFEELFYQLWQQEPLMNFIEIGLKLIDDGSITGSKKSSLVGFLTTFNELSPSSKPSRALNKIIESTNYIQYLKKHYEPDEARERIDNVKELVRAVDALEQKGTHEISIFLHDVALMQEKQDADKETADTVFMMTLHAAKGLEFKTVIISGVEEGILPSSRSLNELEKLEEERRLFYVGITRAQDNLLLTRCKHRYSYGKVQDQISSRFLDEVPGNLIRSEDLSRAQQSMINRWFMEWFKKTGTSRLTHPIMENDWKEEQIKNKQKFFLKTGKSTGTLPASGTSDPLKNTESNTIFKKDQTVEHQTFGIGVILTTEIRSDNDLYAQVKFKAGTKKIAGKFLKAL